MEQREAADAGASLKQEIASRNETRPVHLLCHCAVIALFPRAEAHKLEIYSGDNILLAPLTPNPCPALGRGAPISTMLRTQEHRSILSQQYGFFSSSPDFN